MSKGGFAVKTSAACSCHWQNRLRSTLRYSAASEVIQNEVEALQLRPARRGVHAGI